MTNDDLDLDKIYKDIHPEKIPWNFDTPPDHLVELVQKGTIQPCKTIDLGCGTGYYALYLASKGFDVTGVDISSSAIEIAKENAKKKAQGCSFIVGDVLHELSGMVGTYDFAYDWGILHLIFPENRKRYIENVHAMLTPSGKYLSVCFSEEDTLVAGSGKFRETGMGTVLYFSSEDELKELFTPYFNLLELKKIEIKGNTAPHRALYAFMERKEMKH